MRATSASPEASTLHNTIFKGTLSLFILQFGSRIGTFALNQYIFRLTNPEIFGRVALQLELVLSTVLFLSREPIRLATLTLGNNADDNGEDTTKKDATRKKDTIDTNTKDGETQSCINLAYLSIPIGTVISGIILYYQIHTHTNAQTHTTTTILYLLSALIELLSEPLFILSRNALRFPFRAKLEGLAVLIKTIMIILGVSYVTNQHPDDAEWVVLVFAFAQVVHGCVISIGYYIDYTLHLQTSSQRYTLWPTLVASRSQEYWVLPHHKHRWRRFVEQSFFKHLLTEGDKIILSFLATDYEQGVYAFVANYGSLVARMIFQPIEETSRSYFSKTLQTPTLSTLSSVKHYIHRILFHFNILSLFFITLGTNYTSILIDLLTGHKWSHSPAPFALSMYCFYVPLMGVNGLTESFVHSLGTERDLKKQNKSMVGYWVVFSVVAVVTIRWLELGAVGIVVANAVNMILRIGFSWKFIREYYHRHRDCDGGVVPKDKSEPATDTDKDSQPPSFNNTLPKSILVWILFTISFIGSYTVTHVVDWTSWKGKIICIAVGALLGLMDLVTVLVVEKEAVYVKDTLLRLLKRGKRKTE